MEIKPDDHLLMQLAVAEDSMEREGLSPPQKDDECTQKQKMIQKLLYEATMSTDPKRHSKEQLPHLIMLKLAELRNEQNPQKIPWETIEKALRHAFAKSATTPDENHRIMTHLLKLFRMEDFIIERKMMPGAKRYFRLGNDHAHFYVQDISFALAN